MAKNTREKMIKATTRLIQAHGYHGTSMNEILKKSDSPRGSLYFHFPGGKKTLVQEAIKSGVEEVSAAMEASLKEANDPVEGVKNVYQSIAYALKESNFQIGCPVSPVVLDMPDIGPDIENLCQETFDFWTDMYYQSFVDAGIDPERALRLAKTVLAASEGAIILAKSKQDVSPLSEVAEEMAELIQQALSS